MSNPGSGEGIVMTKTSTLEGGLEWTSGKGHFELLEIAQGYFQVADHIAAAALRATEPDSIPDAE